MENNEVRKPKKFFYTIKEKLAILDFYNTFNASGSVWYQSKKSIGNII